VKKKNGYQTLETQDRPARPKGKLHLLLHAPHLMTPLKEGELGERNYENLKSGNKGDSLMEESKTKGKKLKPKSRGIQEFKRDEKEGWSRGGA